MTFTSCMSFRKTFNSSMWIRFVIVFSILATLASGAIFESATSEVLGQTYDFIVVGAGAGGAVMASRLTEDPRIRVLLIEAGGSDYMNMNISVPGLASTLPKSQFDWNFTTTPQVGLNGRSIPYPRGFVLGGSTAINIMAFCRGTIDDWDRFAHASGDDGWQWNAMLPFILKVDHVTAPTDHHNTTGQFNPKVHSSYGVLDTSLAGVSLPVYARGLNASAELHQTFPFNIDYNSGDTIGLSWIQATIHDGRRVTSATSYLAQAFNRSNLDILVNTHVTKLLSLGTVSGKPDMRGVQLAQMTNGTLHTIHAAKEVIVSAGSIKSPHLLMLSGIGDATHLSSVGIRAIVNLPAVGKNLQDHVLLANPWSVNSNFTLDDLLRNATLRAEMLQLWEINGEGLMGLLPSNQFGWFQANSSVFSSLGVPNPSAGPTSANFEMVLADQFMSRRIAMPSTGRYFTMSTAVISPTSRGNVTLASSDPFTAPFINPNLLGTEVDLAIMRTAVKSARAFMAAPVWEDYIISEFGAFGQAQTDEQLDEYIRDYADTVDHPVGTLAMGKGDEGVLNADLTVKGTVGLRVVDASAFPFIPSGHTQGPTYILAERASALVLEKLRASS